MSPFNESRYRELLEGLEISEVMYSELEYSRRFDAEYYAPTHLKNEKRIREIGSKPLSILSDFLIGPFGSAFTVDNYTEDRTYRYIRGKDVKCMRLMDDDNVYMPKESFFSLSKYALKFNDILVSVVGTIGNAAIIEEKDIPAVFSCKSTVLRTKGMNPRYLLVYLNSKFGNALLKRKERGTVQKGLNLDDLRTIEIYDASDDLQSRIDSLFSRSSELIELSKSIYSQAESLLLSALNLTDYTPDRSNTNIKSFSESFGSSGRLDAEYYQPKFDELEQLIQSNGVYWKRISEIEEYNARGCQPEYYEGGKLNVINSKHILEDHLDYDNFEKTNEIFWTLQPKARVQADDILVYTTGANIGRSNIYQSNEKAMASNHVNILRIRDEDPFYVSFVMNSFIGRMQTDKLSAGSAQAELYPKDISQFMIPFVDPSIQQKIRENIIESLALKRHSSEFLETAKRAVEIAIEDSESSALAFIGERGR